MNKVFKVGLIGCGHIAETYFRAEKYFNNIKIIKCADINEKASKRCALNFGIKSAQVKGFLESNQINTKLKISKLSSGGLSNHLEMSTIYTYCN